MSFQPEPQLFNETCAPLQLPCYGNTFHIDPCDCRVFIQCVNLNQIVRTSCSTGTLFDPASGGCQLEELVLEDGKCDLVKPWQRCEDMVTDPYDQNYLAALCGFPNVDPDDPNGPGGGGGGGGGGGLGGGGDGGGDNTGAIVGGVLAGVVVVAVVVALFVYWRKRGGRLNFMQGGRRANENAARSEHKGGANDEEEVYDVIDEKAISVEPGPFSNPDYNNSMRIQGHTNLGFEPKQQGSHVTADNDGYSLASAVSQPPQGANQLRLPGSREDLSRTISVGGRDVLIQDMEGYQVAHPSGTVPRQPLHKEDHDNEQFSRPGGDYFTLEKDAPYY
ncbi:uncharacterized protein LOC101848036 [Aplysia californica]|uniref:Uncharacterized protein LOC101848036 n=1 Tax=Aplysia californica TaxID=6500 RepID=A0ABM0ZXK1_APLCA|nr:uncharacterized protein LOC101848036 [Aplysia californica]